MNQNKSFIETQFPVSKLSKESYKERKAGSGQTLTGLGKWWGRKPLVLVRASLLGLLMPATDNPKKDMQIFLKIMSMDNEGLIKRRKKAISAKDAMEMLTPKEKSEYLDIEEHKGKTTVKFKKEISDKNTVIEKAWNRMTYDQKLTYCVRPEEIDDRDSSTWAEINDHLKTNASCLQELIDELGKRRFGRRAIVGDCFCGGGSVPFEAARMGFDVYASDLNPVAGLLTWASLNIAGASDSEITKLRDFQQNVYDKVDQQIKEWGIETNEKGDRANSYLYCCETICPECGWKLPLAPSWVIGKATKTIAVLKDNGLDGIDIEVKSSVSDKEMKEADHLATVRKGSIYCPHCERSTPVVSLRNDRKNNYGSMGYGLRKWEKQDFIPRKDDIFQEKLYCIRYAVTQGKRYYTAPTQNDLWREKKVIDLLTERFFDWQENGFIPNSEIEEGEKTNELARTRGWKYWHQLFNPRQLLVHGLFMEKIWEMAKTNDALVMGLLGINRICNWNSKLSQWINDDHHINAQTFYNQAFNTFYNYSVRSINTLLEIWSLNLLNEKNIKNIEIKCSVEDSRATDNNADLWITDPPYADAINYHELSEFFLAWDKKLLKKAFPDWYIDSKRVLAVKGRDETFNSSMIEIYGNLTKNMPENGMQIIMFTHQDVRVWAGLTYILWGSGLRVTAAWNIATETESGGLKSGNYVKGTVLLVLRKQTSNDLAFQDDLYDEIKKEVIGMIDSMRVLDDKEEPNFTDADYLLASYASALKVITTYKEIDGIDLHYWLNKDRDLSDEENPVENLLRKAVRIAYDYLIPEGFDRLIWQDLAAEERFFIRALELEMNGESRNSAYQELARGFGVGDYKEMFADLTANKVKLKTPTDYKMRFLDTEGFGSTVLRKVFVGIYETSKSESTREGIHYLQHAFADNQFYFHKKMMIELLDFISKAEYASDLANWHQPAHFAKLLKEALKNEGV